MIRKLHITTLSLWCSCLFNVVLHLAVFFASVTMANVKITSRNWFLKNSNRDSPLFLWPICGSFGFSGAHRRMWLFCLFLVLPLIVVICCTPVNNVVVTRVGRTSRLDGFPLGESFICFALSRDANICLREQADTELKSHLWWFHSFPSVCFCSSCQVFLIVWVLFNIVEVIKNISVLVIVPRGRERSLFFYNLLPVLILEKVKRSAVFSHSQL